MSLTLLDNVLLVLYTISTTAPTILSIQLRNNPDYSDRTENKIETSITSFYFISAGIMCLAIGINIYLLIKGNKGVMTDRLTNIGCKFITFIYLIYAAITKINPRIFSRRPEPTEQSKVQNLPTEQPKVQNLPTEQPKVQNLPTEQPKVQNLPTEQPKVQKKAKKK
jgi:hypothetical protein